jgi:ABC-type nitrate/sulfonate/bicarbonate transport system permease component
MNMKITRALWFLSSLCVSIALITLWQSIADARLISPAFLPGPDRAWAALVEGMLQGDLLHKLFSTVERMIYGWLLASIIGIALGAIIGISPVARAYLLPTLEMIRPLPASAVIPVAISFFGLSDGMVLAVISFGALWPMLLSTTHGFIAVEPRLYEVARALGLNRWDIIRKIALPSALPDILAGLRIGLTISLILAVVGEMLSSSNGLGQWILFAGRSFRAADLFAGIILLGLIGFISAALLGAAERYLLRWRIAH